jgi:hypothetical protein
MVMWFVRKMVLRNLGLIVRVFINKKGGFLIKKSVFFIFVLLFIVGCGEEDGQLRIWLTDTPPPQDVENIYLTILAVGIVNAEDEAGTIQGEINTFDIVKLAGGYVASLTHNYSTGGSFIDVEPGEYKSVLLALAQINSVVKGGSVADSLLIPDQYYPFSYELEQDFTILPGEYVTIVIDFDASKSINWETQPYQLVPHFRIFESSTAGFIQGTVKTLEGVSEVPVKFAVLEAVSLNDTMTALSDTAGNYLFFLPEGTYGLSVSAEGYNPDTTYESVVVIRDSVLSDYDFMLE